MKMIEIVQSDGVQDVGSPNTTYLGIIDSKGNFIFINSWFSKNLHAGILTILYKSFFEFIHPDDLERCRHAMAHCVLAGGKHDVEIRLKGNNHRWIKWEITRLGVTENSLERFLLSGTDIAREGQAKRSVKLNGHHYETILERLGVGILCQDKNGRVIAANQKAAEIFNASLEELYQDKIFEQLWETAGENGNPVSFEKSPPMIALKSGLTQADVLLSIPNDGNERRYVHFTAQPVFDNNPSVPDFVVSTISDISEEKRLRALCEQREELFASFMNHSPSFAWIVDKDEKVVYANRGLLAYFGTDETVLNKHIYHILPRSIADAGHEKHKWVMENNLPHSSILKSQLADGQEQIFHVTAFPVDGDRKMVGGQAWNITESYQAKLELKRANERLLYLSRAVSEAIWDWNIESGQIFRNQPLLKLIGYHDEKPEGLGWWYKQIHPDDRQKVEKKIEHILASKKKAWEQEYRFLCADGSYKIVLDRGFVVYQQNNPVRMVGSLQDISEIKQLEAKLFREQLKKQKQIAEAILRAQEQERTRIGHELHDNVNQILFTSKLYLDLVKTAGVEEKEIKEKTQSFILLAIEEIRKLSKELVTPQLKENGLISCINELIGHLDIVDPFQTRFVPSDEEKIELLDFNIKVTLFRIIQEQIKNIIKYSEAKNVLLELSVKDAASSKKVDLLIADDGIGFDAHQTRRGIGLSNIYERTSLYNGKVDLRTKPGKGCSIRITIPFA
jgi:PAS domain S-box-containing protein